MVFNGTHVAIAALIFFAVGLFCEWLFNKPVRPVDKGILQHVRGTK